MTTPLEADRLHLGPSATVAVYETSHDGPDRSSRPAPLRRTGDEVVAAITPGSAVWCSLRSVEPLALRASLDGSDVLTGEPFEPGWTPGSNPMHLYLPEQRFLDRAAGTDAGSAPISGPDETGRPRVLRFVAHRLRGRPFASWWRTSGAEARWNRWGRPPTVLGGDTPAAARTSEPVADPFEPDDWDPDPIAEATVLLVRADRSPGT